MRAFIDTNVIVDVVAKREPFFADSQAILALCAMGEINVRHFKNSPIGGRLRIKPRQSPGFIASNGDSQHPTAEFR